MSSPKDWQFRQLGPPSKVMILTGWSAPFGRQRKEAILEDTIAVRQKTTYYPGTDSPPTRHVFGVKYEPWELKGRFMDTTFDTASVSIGSLATPKGAGYARTQTEYVKAFVRDQQPVSISWGDILAVNGFIEKFTASRESEQQVAWKMIVLVDEDQNASAALTVNLIPVPRSYLPNLVKLALPIPTKPPLFRPSLLDALDNIVSTFNSSIASLTAIVNSIDSFERAILGDIKRLRAGIGQVRTASISLRNIIDSIQTSSLLISRSAASDIRGLSYVTQADVDLIRTLGAMAELDRQAEIAERGKASTNYVVQLGDTWESISTRYSGGPERAQKLRELNAVKYGGQPEPGRTVKIPIV